MQKSITSGLLSAGILLFTMAAMAQENARPALAPATGPAEVPKGITLQPGGTFIINFKSASIDTVLDELSRAAGFSVVRMTQTNSERVPSIVNLSGVTRAETMTLINVALNELGYALVPKGNVLQLHRKSDAMTKAIPVRSINKPDEVPLDDELMTAVVTLRYALADQLRQDLGPMIDPAAIFTSNASSNALIITDVSSNIRHLVEIIRSLDSNLADSSQVRVFSLRSANAQDVAKLINDLYGQSQSGGGGFGGAGTLPGAFPGTGSLPGGGGFVPVDPGP